MALWGTLFALFSDPPILQATSNDTRSIHRHYLYCLEVAPCHTFDWNRALNRETGYPSNQVAQAFPGCTVLLYSTNRHLMSAEVGSCRACFFLQPGIIGESVLAKHGVPVLGIVAMLGMLAEWSSASRPRPSMGDAISVGVIPS